MLIVNLFEFIAVYAFCLSRGNKFDTHMVDTIVVVRFDTLQC